MELVGQPGKARVEIEVELLGRFDAYELLPAGRLGRSGKGRHRATAATPVEPNVDAAAALFDELGRWIGDDDTHNRE